MKTILYIFIFLNIILINAHAQESVEPGTPFALTAQSSNISLKEPLTKVVISKILQENPVTSTPEMIIKVKTPKLVYLNFVMAVDTSGSMGLGGDPDFGKTIKEAIPDALDEIGRKYNDKIINVSFVCWDDKVEYESKNFQNIFSASNEFRNISLDYSEYKGTNFAEGVNASVTYLNTHKQNNIDKSRKFIIFLTGRSEFKNYSIYSLNEAKNYSYQIYPIGFNVQTEPPSQMATSLQSMAIFTNGSPLYSPGTESWTRDQIKDLIIQQINFAMNDIILRDLEVNDSLDYYINPIEGSLKVNIDGVNVDENKAILYQYNEVNQDRTKNVIIKLANGLKPDSTMEITYDLGINFDVPFSQPNMNNSKSQVSFTWHNGIRFPNKISTNDIHVSSIKREKESGVFNALLMRVANVFRS